MILLGNGEPLGMERVKRKLELVQDDAEGWRKKKDSGTKDKAAHLAAEAAIFEKGQWTRNRFAQWIVWFCRWIFGIWTISCCGGRLTHNPYASHWYFPWSRSESWNCIVKQRPLPLLPLFIFALSKHRKTRFAIFLFSVMEALAAQAILKLAPSKSTLLCLYHYTTINDEQAQPKQFFSLFTIFYDWSIHIYV